MTLDAQVTHESPSWVRLPDPAPAADAVTAIFEATRQKIGFVRNQQRVLAHKPDILAAVTALGDAVVRDVAGTLTPRERELMALVVSAENRCEACVWMHAAALRALSGDPAWVATIEVNFRRAALTPRERALADFALKATRAPAEIEPADLRALRDVGVAEIGLVEAASVVAYFNFTNRLNSSLGIHANVEAYSANR